MKLSSRILAFVKGLYSLSSTLDSLIKQAITQLFKKVHDIQSFLPFCKFGSFSSAASRFSFLSLGLLEMQCKLEYQIPGLLFPFLKCILHVEIKLQKPRKFYLFYLVTFLTCMLSTPALNNQFAEFSRFTKYNC